MKKQERYIRTTDLNDALRAQLKETLESRYLGGQSMAEAYAADTLVCSDYEAMADILEALRGSFRLSAEAEELAGKGKVAQACMLEQGITLKLKSAIERYAKSSGSCEEQNHGN